MLIKLSPNSPKYAEAKAALEGRTAEIAAFLAGLTPKTQLAAINTMYEIRRGEEFGTGARDTAMIIQTQQNHALDRYGDNLRGLTENQIRTVAADLTRYNALQL